MKRFLILVLGLMVSPLLVAGWVWLQIPSENQIRGCLTTKMFQVELCPKNRNYVNLRDISPYLVKTIVLTEDSLFWEHGGFDWESIKRNYEENKRLGRYKRGGSTISQQLAKNLFLTAEKTFVRKGLEALITLKIERVLTKREILERYLNVIEFGKNIYGIRQASQHYFKKHPRNLTVVESAFLAMLLPNPRAYAASFYRKELTPFASRRIRQIVDNMYHYKRIEDHEYDSALLELESFFRPPDTLQTDGETSTDSLTLENLEEEAEQEDRF
ncbi:MAG: monofunctional biosynthetic peptidoglycan transglycosylase [Bdellovibrionales bacterium]